MRFNFPPEISTVVQREAENLVMPDRVCNTPI
jgi:hypothetical protein